MTATSLNANPRWVGINADACYRYTLSRQTLEGGFCFYASPEWRVAEPNAPDTYAALTILSLLGRPVPRAADCAAWVTAQQDRRGGFVTLIVGFAALKSLHLLGAEPSRNPSGYLEKQGRRLWSADRARRNLVGWLASACRCIGLWHDYGIGRTDRVRARLAAILRRLLNDDGGYGTPGSNLPETAAAQAIADELGLEPDPGILAYVRSCEGAPFGFNIARRALSSSLETEYAGIRVLRRFGACPGDPLLIRNYVSSCQSSAGGFGRAPGAIPRLDDTRRALAILSALPTAATEFDRNPSTARAPSNDRSD